MKAVRFVFALYILFMAVYPCSDNNTCLDEQRLGTVVTTADHNHEPDEQDMCTPFCICSCCAAHVQIRNANYTSFVSLLHNTVLVSVYLEKPILSNGDSIWQPPRS